jgi:hypothetical protein
MPVDVITGQPGASKTLLMMERLERAIKANADAVDKGVPALVVDVDGELHDYPVRPIYAAGVNGLKPGLAESLKDPTKWNEIDPNGEPTCNCPAQKYPHAHVIPDGSLILVDEAWRWFGHMHDASRMPTPKHALDLAIHRHRGLDFIFTTQSIKQIYPFVREIGGSHTNIVRLWGSKFSKLYTWGEWNENVKSITARDNAVSDTWAQRKDLYSWYRSASVHTIKLALPRKLLMIPVLIVLMLVLGVFGFRHLFSKESAERANKETAAAVAEQKTKKGTPDPENQKSEAGSNKPSTAAEWVTALTPVLPGIAYTAPIFSESLQVNTHPRTLCVEVGKGGADGCHCYTEQATPLVVADGLCRELTARGYYDPFKPDPESPPAPAEKLDAHAQAEAVAVKLGNGDPALEGVPMPQVAGASSKRLDASSPHPP